MSFDLFAQQDELLARLATVAGGFAIVGTFDRIDLTDDGAATTGAQLRFTGFSPSGQAGRSARHDVQWSFDVLVDTGRASSADKTAAASLFNAAMGALIGWEIGPGRSITAVQGQDSDFDGRVLRISFGFTVPVFLAGT